MEYWIKFFSVILAVTLADICWVYYFIKIEERKILASGLWSAVIVLLGAFSVTQYADDKSFIIAAVIGAFIGTAGTVWYKKHKEK